MKPQKGKLIKGLEIHYQAPQDKLKDTTDKQTQLRGLPKNVDTVENEVMRNQDARIPMAGVPR